MRPPHSNSAAEDGPCISEGVHLSRAAHLAFAAHRAAIGTAIHLDEAGYQAPDSVPCLVELSGAVATAMQAAADEYAHRATLLEEECLL